MNVLTNAWNIFAISHFAWPANFFSHAGVSLHWSELFRAKMTNWNNTICSWWMPQLPHCIGKLNGLEEKENAWFQNLQLSLFEAWQCQVDNKSLKLSIEWRFEVIWTDPNGRQAMCICTCIFVIVYLYLCLLLVCLNLYNCVSARIAALKWSGPIKIDDWR